jgi:predicted ArsR family transcriptional regulator
MDVQELLAADAGLPLGRRRAEVLDLLRAAASPLSVQDVADRVGLHVNSARFHLDALVEAGLAARAPQPRSTPGRPSMAYQAVDGGTAAAGQRHFRLLAEMLTSLVAGMLPDPGQAATQAGREWGRYLTEQPAPYQRLSAGEAIGKLTATLEDIGFAPQAPDGEAPDGKALPVMLRLRQCPFREVAEGHQDVVCALHLGLMQGALAQMRAPVTADRLEPFAEPSLCLAHLEARP